MAFVMARGGKMAKQKDAAKHELLFPRKKTKADKAAMQHWIETARDLIVSIEYESNPTTEYRAIPYYVRDPSAETNKQGYRSITSFMDDKEEARLLLVEEFKRVSALLSRARAIAAILNMESDVIEIQKNITQLNYKIENRANN